MMKKQNPKFKTADIIIHKKDNIKRTISSVDVENNVYFVIDDKEIEIPIAFEFAHTDYDLYLEDRVNNPKHYTQHPSGVECIEITRHYDFCIGNAIKYLWRSGLKNEQGYSNKEKEIEDLEKAIWYINDKIKQLKKCQEE